MTTAVDRLRPVARSLGPALVILALQQVLYPVPLGIFVRGLVVGGLTALVALGMALIYRSNRILNFAQGDMGGIPAVLVIMLMTAWGWNYWFALSAGVVAALLVGALVELLVIRRFFKSPRLILTVATIGLSQLLAALALLLPNLWGETLLAPRIAPPFDFSFKISGITFNGNDILAMVFVPVAIAILAWFLQRTTVGIGIRASATSSDRASLLGVPVKRLQTLVWTVAGLLAFVATFLRAGILGLPVGYALSFGVLLRALTALVMGRLTNLLAITTSAIALGALELGIQWNAESPLLIDPILAVVVFVALLLQKRRTTRADLDDSSSWQAADEVRPLPRELKPVTEVRLVRWLGGAVLLAAVLVLPHLLSVDRSLKASAVIVYAILALSLVVLTGWAGQVSLGQVAFFAIGAVSAAKAIVVWDLDPILALLLAAVVGAVVAMLVGIPALRQRGLFLAVITFAFSLATTSYLLNDRFFDWVPSEHFDRPKLLGVVSLDSPTAIYYLALGCLGVAALALRGIRRSRTGRVLIALRENERATSAYGVSVVRAKLTAFGISGALAGFAGGLFVIHQQAFGSGPYEPSQNFAVFTMAVIGGIGSMVGAVLGALYLRGSQWFLPADWQFVATGVGVLAVLMVIPDGLGGQLYRLRDLWLRSVARRNGIVVPSLAGESLDDRVEDHVALSAAAESSASVDEATGIDESHAGDGVGEAPEAPVEVPR